MPQRGLILAAPSSGSGKTTLTLGLLRALSQRGIDVRGAKSGPDYIDPRFHEAASGRPSINLDAWAMSKRQIRSLAHGEGLLLVEGAMGLFDGAPDGDGATADLARILDLPVALEARPWREDGTVVLEVEDSLGHTAGRWRVTTEKGQARVERTEDSPGVSLSAETLATLYLGDRLVPTLAAAGRVTGPDVETFAAMADHAGPAPYCRTGF